MRQISRMERAAPLVAFAFGLGCSSGNAHTSEDSGTISNPGSGTSSSGSSGPSPSGSPGTSSGQVTGGSGAVGASGPAGHRLSAAPREVQTRASLRTLASSPPTTRPPRRRAPSPPRRRRRRDRPLCNLREVGRRPERQWDGLLPDVVRAQRARRPSSSGTLEGNPGNDVCDDADAAGSQSFAAYACATSSSAGTEVKDGIDWMIAQNAAQGNMCMGKLGHDEGRCRRPFAGCLAVFANAGDSRLTATVHVSGGAGGTTAATLKVPAVYLCGERAPRVRRASRTATLRRPIALPTS